MTGLSITTTTSSLDTLKRNLQIVVKTHDRKGAWRLSVDQVALTAVHKALGELAVTFIKWTLMAATSCMHGELMIAGTLAAIALPQLYDYSKKACEALGLPGMIVGACLFPSAGAVTTGIMLGHEIRTQYTAHEETLLARIQAGLLPPAAQS